MAKLKGAKEVLKEYKRSEDGSGSRGYSSHALVKLLRGGNGKQEVSSRESINSLPQPVNPGFHAQPQMLQSQVPKVSQQHHGNAQANRDDKMLKVLQNQNAITELLVKQQGQSQLPTKDMPVLKGDVTHCSTNLSSEHSSTQLNKIQTTIRTNCMFWNNLQLVNPRS